MATSQDSVDLVDDDVVRSFARAALLAALLGAVAYVEIPLPFSPVPITLQTLVVYLAGLYLGPRWGGVSLVLYLAAGAVGAPVFSGGEAGPGVLFGPTGGFLWSFPVAAILIGTIVHGGTELRDPASASIPRLVGALAVGSVVTFAMGATWLAWVQNVGLIEALSVGVVPFLPGNVLKVAAAIAIVESGRIDPTR